MGFVMEFFNHMGGEMGMPKPVFDTRADMLWDAPAIGPAKVSKKIIDCLIVNADPLSGQCQGYSRSDLYQKVVLPLIARFGCSVITTNCSDAGTSTGHTLSEIGALATMAKRIITVATGPSWPTWNVWSKDAERIVILDPMRLDFGPMDAPVHHAANADEVRRICEERGWL